MPRAAAAEQRLLERTGAAVNVPAAGCCGMAGAFGFEAAHYGVAQAAGGFSCREQIRHGTGRTPVHLADVLAAGLTKENP